jgi:hypothetical protein
MGIFESRSGLYRISREDELSVLNDPVDLRIVSKQFKNSLRYAGYKYIHQRMYIIGIKGMTRKKLGTKVLLYMFFYMHLKVFYILWSAFYRTCFNYIS